LRGILIKQFAMKKYLLILLVIFITFFSHSQNVKLQIFHFYANERCPGDQRIELLTIKTLDSLFKIQLKNKTITRRSVNFELKSNAKLVKKINVSTIALIFNIIDAKGNESYVDLTDWAFKNVWNEEKFRSELQDKINGVFELKR
jgi:hypothetical protein